MGEGESVVALEGAREGEGVSEGARAGAPEDVSEGEGVWCV